MKVFYTIYEGGPILEEDFTKKKYDKLLSELKAKLLLVKLTDPNSIDFSSKLLKFINIQGLTFHSIFIDLSSDGYFRRWDTVNGWNEGKHGEYHIDYLIKAVNSNKNKTGE